MRGYHHHNGGDWVLYGLMFALGFLLLKLFGLCAGIRRSAAFRWVSINGTIRVPRLARLEGHVCWAFQTFLEFIGGSGNCSTGPSLWQAGFRNWLERRAGF